MKTKRKPLANRKQKPAESPVEFTHGGARQGAGRKAKKPAEKRKARLLMLTDAEKKRVDAMRGKQTFSAYIRNRLGLEE